MKNEHIQVIMLNLTQLGGGWGQTQVSYVYEVKKQGLTETINNINI